MAKKIDDTVKDINELRSRFSMVKDDYSQFYGVKDIYDVRTFPSDPGMLYLYFIGNDNSIKDRLTYGFCTGHSEIIQGDHIIKGHDFNELYRELEFCTVNFILGRIYDNRS